MLSCHALGLGVLLILNRGESLLSELTPGDSRGEETKLLRISLPLSSHFRDQRRSGEEPLVSLSPH